MSTLFSKEGDPGKSWKLTRGAGGIRLWVPPIGKHKKQYNFDRLPADLADKISKIIDVPVDQLPQVLLDALRSSGEMLFSNIIPCTELCLVLSCCVLVSSGLAD